MFRSLALLHYFHNILHDFKLILLANSKHKHITKYELWNWLHTSHGVSCPIDSKVFQWKCPLQNENGLAFSKMKFHVIFIIHFLTKNYKHWFSVNIFQMRCALEHTGNCFTQSSWSPARKTRPTTMLVVTTPLARRLLT